MVHMLAFALVGPARGEPSAPSPDVGQTGPQSKPAVILPRDFDARSLHRDEPPVQPPRNVAEFERMQGVLIRYPLGIPYALIAEMSVADTVFTLVANQAEENQAAAQYASHGVNMSNARFMAQSDFRKGFRLQGRHYFWAHFSPSQADPADPPAADPTAV